LIATWISVRSVVPPPMSQTSSSRVSASSSARLLLMAEQPVVERRLRFLEQAQLGQAGLPCGFQRQRARAFVEGRGNGQDHLLLFERCLRETVPPGGADMRQIAGAGGDRRHLGDAVFGTPGQDRRHAVDRGVRQPALGAGDQATGNLRAEIERQRPAGDRLFDTFARAPLPATCSPLSSTAVADRQG
jgi:hypothetical protein